VRDWFAEEWLAEPADRAVLAPLGYWTVRENRGADRADLALYAETVRELGIAFVPYSPLGRGFLTGRFQRPEDIPEGDWRRKSPRFQGGNFQKKLALVERVKQIAVQRSVTPGQLALAWLLAQGDNIAPIPGTKRRKYLEENAAAAEVELDQTELDSISEALPSGAAAGQRYPDMSTVNR